MSPKTYYPTLNPGTEQDKLLQYINRKLTDEEKHALEKYTTTNS